MSSKRNHEPGRTCLGCMKRDEQKALVRIASANGAIVLDADRRLPGRGGYLHPRGECLKSFAASRIKEFRSLKRKINRDERLAIVNSIMRRLDSGAMVA
ncbi:MAG: YlxR family protein [Candidatus Binataceae bacterium]